YRYAYGVGQGETRGFLDSLVKLDLERGTASKWREEGCYPVEPVFVEAPGTSNEDECVILSVVLDGRAATSYLLVLDASTFAERARAEAPHHIPFGFPRQLHGEDFVELVGGRPAHHHVLSSSSH